MSADNSPNGSEKTSEPGPKKSVSPSRPDRFRTSGSREPRKVLERVIDRIDNSERLSRVGQSLTGLAGKLIKPGKFKDLVSGTWLGHPIHPMLSDLPIGFWTSSFVLDMVPNEKLHETSDAFIGLGIATALPTAIAGFSDLSDVDEDEGLSVGTAHALGNSAALACYILSLAARRAGDRRAGVALSTAGAAFATAGGYFGGHMILRRGIGVNQTAFETPPGEWTRVKKDGALKEGRPVMVRVDGDDVLLYRSGEKIYALANRCSHRGGPLNEGEIKDGTVTCSWHQSTFKLKDGSVVNGPATAPQPAYEVRTKDGQIEVRAAQK